MTIGYSGVANEANTSSGYALGVSAANTGKLVGLGTSGPAVADTFSGVIPSGVAYFILLETSGYLVQETGTAPNNRFELE